VRLAKEPRSSVSRRRRIAFTVVVAVFAVVTALLTPLPFLVLGWFLEEPGTVSHKVHEISFGALFALILVGLLAQLRGPERKLGPLAQVVVPLAVTILVLVLIANESDPILVVFAVFPLVIIALHPGRHYLLRPPTSLSPPMMTLVLIAAIPMLIFAIQQLETAYEAGRIAPEVFDALPESASDEEFEAAIREGTSPATRQAVQHYGHWSAMGAFSLSLLILAVVAALRPPGWRIVAWSAGLGVMVYGLASLLNPTDASAHGGPAAIAALLWGGALIVTAERERRALPSGRTEAEVPSPPEPLR
jgi:hypothetical protein